MPGFFAFGVAQSGQPSVANAIFLILLTCRFTMPVKSPGVKSSRRGGGKAVESDTPRKKITPRKLAGPRKSAKRSPPVGAEQPSACGDDALSAHAAKPRAERKPKVARLVRRVQMMVERDLRAIGRILATLAPLPENVAQAERAARTLASLSRTLREVTKLSAETPKAKSDDDSLPKDIGELRDVVSRRLAKLIADAEAAYPHEQPGA